MVKVSYSRVNSYLSCPYSHYLGYILKLKVNKPIRPLTFGKDFHKLLQFRNKKSELRKAMQEIRDSYNDLPVVFQAELGDNYIDDLRNVFNDYRAVWKGALQPIKTEHEFLIEMGKLRGEPVYFHGVLDEIYEELILGEHKTFKYAPDMGILAMNMQVCLYAKAWHIETGKLFERVRWDYIKSIPAEPPVWLEKSNRFSDASTSKVTPQSYLRGCKEHGITDEAVLAKANNYSKNIGNFYFKCDIEIVPSMIDSTWCDFKDIVKDIVLHGEKKTAKNISRNCGWCKFRPICYAEFTGADAKYVIDRDYTVRSEDDSIEDIISRIGGE